MGTRRTPTLAMIAAYVRLPHALPVAIVVATTGVLSVMIDPAAHWPKHATIVVTMLGAQLVIGIVNELVDLDIDRVARPDKPLVSGLVSSPGAVRLLVVAVLVMIGAGALLGVAALLVCLAGCALGVGYSLWLKRTPAAFLPYVLAIPLLPVWVALSHGELDAGWLLLFPLGAFGLTGVQFAQALPDIDADRVAGIRSATTLLGERRSLTASWVFVSLSALLLVATNAERLVCWLAAFVVWGGVAANIQCHRLRPRRAVRLAFPTAALGTAVLGVAWVYAAGTN